MNALKYSRQTIKQVFCMKQAQNLIVIQALRQKQILLSQSSYATDAGELAKWSKYKQIHVERKSKKGIISLDVGLLDVDPEGPPDKPVVMAIHGAPGSALDFDNLIVNLASKGVRCIVPDLPGFGSSQMVLKKVFELDYSTDGKFVILQEIIKSLDLSRIDVMIGHSAGTHLVYKACSDLKLIRAGAFLNPLSGELQRAARPLFMVKIGAALLKSDLIRPLMYPAVKLAYKLAGFKITDVSPLPVALQIVANVQYDQISGYIEKIKERRLPFAFFWTKSDRLVEWHIPYDVVKQLGMTDDEISIYDKQNKLGRAPTIKRDWFRRALLFERGGHLVHKAQEEQVTSCLFDLIEHVKQRS